MSKKRRGKIVAWWRKYIPYLLTLVALSIFLVYLYRNADRYSNLFRFSWQLLVVSVFLVLIGLATNGLVNYFLYRELGARVGLNEAFGLSAVNTLANQLPFAAGLMVKGAYLKRRFQLTYSRYFSATVALYFVFLTAAGVVGTLIMIGQLFTVGPTSPLLLGGFAIMAGSITAFWLPLQRLPLPVRWEKRFEQMLEGWQVLREERVLLLKIILVYLIMMLSVGGRYWIAFNALSQDVTLQEGVLFAAASILTQLVSTTPGGLGVREGIVAAVASVHGIAPDVSIVAVGLDRLIATTMVVSIGTVYSYFLSKGITEAEELLPDIEQVE